VIVSEVSRRDRLRELLDAVVDADNADVGDMLARHGVGTGRGDPLEWMRGN
jgi:hypothetical protein